MKLTDRLRDLLQLGCLTVSTALIVVACGKNPHVTVPNQSTAPARNQSGQAGTPTDVGPGDDGEDLGKDDGKEPSGPIDNGGQIPPVKGDGKPVPVPAKPEPMPVDTGKGGKGPKGEPVPVDDGQFGKPTGKGDAQDYGKGYGKGGKGDTQTSVIAPAPVSAPVFGAGFGNGNDQGKGGKGPKGSPVQQTQTQTSGCGPVTKTLTVTARALKDAEKASLVLPLKQGTVNPGQSTGTDSSSGLPKVEGKQVVLGFDLGITPEAITAVSDVSLRLGYAKIVTNRTSDRSVELLCFLDHRACSGTSLDSSRFASEANPDFWSGDLRPSSDAFARAIQSREGSLPAGDARKLYSARAMDLRLGDLLPGVDLKSLIAVDAGLVRVAVSENLYVANMSMSLNLTYDSCVGSPNPPSADANGSLGQ